MRKIRAGVMGATGYAGQELVRLLLRHPSVDLVAVTSESYQRKPFSAVYPSMLGQTDLVCREMDVEAVAEDCNVVFLALPHGLALKMAPVVLNKGKKAIDLGADFRLKDPAVYQEWYGHSHSEDSPLDRAVYGLPELHRGEIRGSALVANPGCYPTSAALGAAPLLRAGVVDPDSVIVDSKSGVSGAGRSPSLGVHFGEVNENLKAYGIAGTHRHTPEIEQELSLAAGRPIRVSFTPHLIPMTRGILSTIYFHLTQELSTAGVLAIYREHYAGEPFVKVHPEGSLPQTKYVLGSNLCHIGAQVDRRTERVTVVSVIDNLVKGAAGQAVQNLNLLFGLEETVGLEGLPVFP